MSDKSPLPIEEIEVMPESQQRNAASKMREAKAIASLQNDRDKLKSELDNVRSKLRFGYILIISCLVTYLIITVITFFVKGNFNYIDGFVELLKTVVLAGLGFVFAKMSN